MKTRYETRLPVSKDTLKALKGIKRGGEPYDSLIRRMLISGIPKPMDGLTDLEQMWVLNTQ